MNYEQRYKEALEAVKELQEANPSDDGIKNWVEEKFPELKESGDYDERIRKALIDGFKRYDYGALFNGCFVREILPWLEKQGKANPYSGVSFEYNGHTWGMCARDNGVEILVDGEIKERVFLGNKPQGKSALETIKEEKVDNANYAKPTDKVEPKFKVGNWYQCTKDFFAFDKNTAYYCAEEGCLQDEYGCHIAIVKDLYDNFKLWTIEDASDGDVLAVDDDNVCIFDGTVEDGIYPFAYCGFTKYGFKSYDRKLPFTHSNVYPATKEQRDFLFQKMKEAGYEWDAEKKELKKIENRPMLSDFFNAEYERGKADALKCVEWSEEDERNFQGIIDEIEANKNQAPDYDVATYDKFLSWLKSLKDRVQPQSHWKPSEEQMKALDAVIDEFDGYREFDSLVSLKKDLEKLKGE